MTLEDSDALGWRSMADLIGDEAADYKKVTDTLDVWFDSGAMPFAGGVSGFPADFICEAIDQTRGWFYTLLTTAVLLGRKTPYLKCHLLRIDQR